MRDIRWNLNINTKTNMTQSHSSETMSDFVGMSPNNPNIKVTKSEVNKL